MDFPGPGTAMAFAAAVAAGAAGYSSYYNNPHITYGLIALSVLLAIFTLKIEQMSCPNYKNEQDVNASRLGLINKLPKMVENKAITKEECEKIKLEILSQIKWGIKQKILSLFIR